MKTKTHSQFFITLDALRYIAWNPQGLTVGEVVRAMHGLSYGQVKRIVETLVEDNLLMVETVKHGRTGKKIYRVAENAAIIGSDILNGYTTMYEMMAARAK